MNIFNSSRICLLFFYVFFCSCKKDKTEPTEISKLPPATQTGANIFGCLVNGKAWVAQTDCKFLCNPYIQVNYDPMFGGFLSITGDWSKTTENVDQRIEIVIDSSNFYSSRVINIANSKTTASFSDYIQTGLCNRYKRNLDSMVIHSGMLHITRYDLQRGIISGTFDIKLTKPGCADLVITNGRFDKKIF